jgi:hypothetical protein
MGSTEWGKDDEGSSTKVGLNLYASRVTTEAHQSKSQKKQEGKSAYEQLVAEEPRSIQQFCKRFDELAKRFEEDRAPREAKEKKRGKATVKAKQLQKQKEIDEQRTKELKQ